MRGTAGFASACGGVLRRNNPRVISTPTPPPQIFRETAALALHPELKRIACPATAGAPTIAQLNAFIRRSARAKVKNDGGVTIHCC